MRNVAICAGITITLLAVLAAIGFQENVVLLWAAVTAMVAVGVR